MFASIWHAKVWENQNLKPPTGISLDIYYLEKKPFPFPAKGKSRESHNPQVFNGLRKKRKSQFAKSISHRNFVKACFFGSTEASKRINFYNEKSSWKKVAVSKSTFAVILSRIRQKL